MQKETVSQTTGIQRACSCANNIDMCSLTSRSTVRIDTQNLWFKASGQPGCGTVCIWSGPDSELVQAEMIHGLRQANLHNLKNQALLNKNWIRSHDVFVKLLLAFHLKTGYKFCVNKLHDLSYAAESLCIYLMGTEIFPYLHRKVARIDFGSTVLPWPFPGTTCVNPIAKASLCVRAHAFTCMTDQRLPSAWLCTGANLE